MSCMATAHQLDNEYAKAFTDLIELVYGPELLSQGGTQSIDLLFEGQELNGKKVLDIGSGLGGVDFYIAKKFAVDVTGIDCVQRMVNDAHNRIAKQVLQGAVHFMHQEPEVVTYPFADNTFDIVFSKEAFLHIPNKAPLIKEIYRVLKPGGQLIILDWLVDSPNLGALVTEMMVVDGLDFHMATIGEYQSFCKQAGFAFESVSVLNDLYAKFCSDNIATIQIKHKELIELFGQETYEYCLKIWALQKEIFEKGEVLVTLLKATKV